MAAAAVGLPPSTDSFGSVTHINPTQASQTQTTYPTALKHDVNTILNFHLDNEDGSPPAPVYVNKPESYVRPLDAHNVTIKDVRGEEDKYTLDKNGFEFRRHTSVEKDFVDDEQIKAQYYPETEQLLKDAYVECPSSFFTPHPEPPAA
jgi:ferredoxin